VHDLPIIPENLEQFMLHLRVKLMQRFIYAATSSIYNSQVFGCSSFIGRHYDGFVWGGDAYAA